MNVFAADVRPLYGLPAEGLTQQNRTSVRRQFWLSAGHIMLSRQTHASVMGLTALTKAAMISPYYGVEDLGRGQRDANGLTGCHLDTVRYLVGEGGHGDARGPACLLASAV